MNLEPRVVELSRDNFQSCLETFLRATDVIKDSETPKSMEVLQYQDSPYNVRITIHFKQEETETTRPM